jgi:catechol-2,3-dioxygenase
MEALAEGRRRLLAAGYDVLGPKDHGFCQSIYFFDPNGHRLEMTVRSDKAGELDDMARAAPHQLAEWNERKRRLFGRDALKPAAE